MDIPVLFFASITIDKKLSHLLFDRGFIESFDYVGDETSFNMVNYYCHI